MSGEALKTRETFLPPPVDGVNLISPPTMLKPTEARELINYFPYEWGCRERGAFATITHSPNTARSIFAFPIASASINGFLFTDGTDIFTYNGSAISSSLDTDFFTYAFNYNKRVFMSLFDSDEVATYNLDTDTYAGTSFTNPGSFKFNIGFAFKNRAYFIDNGTGEIRYGGVGAVSGSLSAAYDVAEFFQKGRYLTWGTAWSVNQGNENDDLFVVGNEAGEVFIYAGDYPTAPNWRLVTRVVIPAPCIRSYGPGLPTVDWTLPVGFLPVGQDIWICTVRGVISLAAIVAGKTDDERYYLMSRRLGPIVLNALPGKSSVYPFAYFSDGSSIYVCNYETGAWSNLVGASATQIVCSEPIPSTPTSSKVYALAPYDQAGSFPPVQPAGPIANVLDEAATAADSGASYTWKTPFVNYGSVKQKHHKRSNLIGRVTGGSVLSAAAKIAADFSSTAGTQASNSRTGDGIVPLEPTGVGTWLSHEFVKTGSASHQNELLGVHVIYEEGGY